MTGSVFVVEASGSEPSVSPSLVRESRLACRLVSRNQEVEMGNEQHDRDGSAEAATDEAKAAEHVGDGEKAGKTAPLPGAVPKTSPGGLIKDAIKGK